MIFEEGLKIDIFFDRKNIRGIAGVANPTIFHNPPIYANKKQYKKVHPFLQHSFTFLIFVQQRCGKQATFSELKYDNTLPFKLY